MRRLWLSGLLVSALLSCTSGGGSSSSGSSSAGSSSGSTSSSGGGNTQAIDGSWDITTAGDGPIGASEITKKRRNVRGAVGMAYAGSDPKMAESQFYILRRNDPSLDPRYTVFGAVIKGMDVVDKLEKGDMLKRASVRE